MRVMAQVAMVMALDKCIGCHTCSVTCKQAWTNRAGTEYVWFNNVETRPGQGYPRRYEDQEKWKGGWVLNKRGRLELKSGNRFQKLFSIFASPIQPELSDYYEPWTYDYQNLTTAPLGDFRLRADHTLLSVVNEGDTLGDTVRDNRTTHEDTVGVHALNPFAVLDANLLGVLGAHPSDRTTTEHAQHVLVVEVLRVDSPLVVRGQVANSNRNTIGRAELGSLYRPVMSSGGR